MRSTRAFASRPRRKASSRSNPAILSALAAKDPIGELLVSYRAARVLLSAVELDVFRHVSESEGRAEDVAYRSGADIRATQILLDALVAIGFLQKKRDRYINTPYSRERLMEGGERSAVHNLRYQEFLSGAFAELTNTLRQGYPRRDLKQLIRENPGFVESYIRGMEEIAQKPAQELARALDLSDVREFLDVGAGAGTFSLALLEKKPSIHAVLSDLSETLAYTRIFVSRSPHAKRVSFQAADYHSDLFGENRYDLALLSHITHDESPEENLSLFERAHAALRPGGRLVVHDFMLSESGTSPLFSALFSIHLLAYTRSGRAYRELDYREWFDGAGFQLSERIPIGLGLPNASIALVGRKP